MISALGFINDDNITMSTVFSNNNGKRAMEILQALEGKNVVSISSWRAACVQNPRFPLNTRYSFRIKENCIEEVDLFTDIYNFILENATPTNEELWTSDLNQDTIINIQDIILLINLILN